MMGSHAVIALFHSPTEFGVLVKRCVIMCDLVGCSYSNRS